MWEGTGEGECLWNDFEVPFLFGPTPGSPVGPQRGSLAGPVFLLVPPPAPFFPFLAPTHGFTGGWGRVYALVEPGNQV